VTETEGALARALQDSFRREWPTLVAAATRITGDVASAEEAVQDALVSALARWPFSGVPERPGAWLLTAARNRARNIVRDRSRERARWERVYTQPATSQEPDADEIVDDQIGDDRIGDDRLRLILVCCHPLLSPEAQVVLALRLIGGLSTAQIGRAFLQSESAIAQRLVRAKRALAGAGVPFALPPPEEWSERLPAVLRVAYLIFNEGYVAGDSDDLQRLDLSVEGLRLARLVAEMVDDPEVFGLVALMEFGMARAPTRQDADGDLVLLEHQDRNRWVPEHLEAGRDALRRAIELEARGAFTLQAEIAACHANAPSFAATDWCRVIELYDALMLVAPSPVVALNRVVALAMAHGAQVGLRELEQIVSAHDLDDYHLLWATRADLMRRLGRWPEAASDYRRALMLTTNAAEQRFLSARLRECATT
jgi:RNA polymerase sigma-70 factor, ECF subfamily